MVVLVKFLVQGMSTAALQPCKYTHFDEDINLTLGWKVCDKLYIGKAVISTAAQLSNTGSNKLSMLVMQHSL